MHPIEHLKVHSRHAAENLDSHRPSRAFRNSCYYFPLYGRGRSECQTVEEMKLSWRQVKQGLFGARDATLMLAVIAGFAAWIITQLLRAALG